MNGFNVVAAELIPVLIIALFLGTRLFGQVGSSQAIILPSGVTSSLRERRAVALGVLAVFVVLGEIVAIATQYGISEGWFTKALVSSVITLLLGLLAIAMFVGMTGKGITELTSREEKIVDVVGFGTIALAWLLIVVPILPWFRDQI